MSDQTNLISDVRLAKEWVDSHAATFDALAARLREIESAYQARSGEFASVPTSRPDSVRRAIDAAADEPGRDFMSDLRPAS